MNEPKLGVGQLLEGGFWQLWEAKGPALFWLGAFALLQLVFLLAERQDLAFVADLAELTNGLTIVTADLWWVWLLINMIVQSVLLVLATTSLLPSTALPKLEGISVPRLFGAAILANLFASLAVGFGLILLIFPGLYLAARWYLLLPLIISGRSKPSDAFSASWDALDGRVGALIGAMLVLFVPLALHAGIELSVVDSEELPGMLSVFIDALLTGANSVFGIAISIFAYRQLFQSGEEYRTVFD